MMILEDTSICLERVHVRAYHGLLPHERCAGNDFYVTLRVHLDALEAMRSDTIGGTIDYSALYALLLEEMAIPSDLLEHVAYRILDRIGREFSRSAKLRRASVMIQKMTPPIPSFDASGVSFEASVSYMSPEE